MGSVVGGQVAGMMNNSMQNMQQQAQPVSRPLVAPHSAVQYNVAVNGQATGPFDMDTLGQMAQSGRLTPQSQVWKQGMSGWAAAGTMQELAGLFNSGGLPPKAAGSSTGSAVGATGVNMPPPASQYQYNKESTMHIYDERNFYSLDRLTKFGMSTAVAQQMVNSMNFTIQNMLNPGVLNSMQTPEQKQRLEQKLQELQERGPQIRILDTVYYAIIDGEQAGPFCETEIGRLINTGRVCNKTYIWHTGLNEWTAAENIPAVVRLVALVPPPPPQLSPPPPPEES